MVRDQVNRQSTQDAVFNQLKVERFTSELGRAKNHVIGRDRRIVRVFAYLSLLRNDNLVLPNAALGVTAAKFQHFSSTEGNQAAHYLPGQLLVNGHMPAIYLKSQEARIHCNNLFGDVENLPAHYNRADTELEKYSLMKKHPLQAGVNIAGEENGEPGELGLCHVFLVCSQHLVQTPHGNGEGKANRRLIHEIYQEWSASQRPALERAIAKKTEASSKAGIDVRTRERRVQEIRCLKAYKNALEDPNNLQTHRHIEIAVKEVEETTARA